MMYLWYIAIFILLITSNKTFNSFLVQKSINLDRSIESSIFKLFPPISILYLSKICQFISSQTYPISLSTNDDNYQSQFVWYCSPLYSTYEHCSNLHSCTRHPFGVPLSHLLPRNTILSLRPSIFRARIAGSFFTWVAWFHVRHIFDASWLRNSREKWAFARTHFRAPHQDTMVYVRARTNTCITKHTEENAHLLAYVYMEKRRRM